MADAWRRRRHPRAARRTRPSTLKPRSAAPGGDDAGLDACDRPRSSRKARYSLLAWLGDWGRRLMIEAVDQPALARLPVREG
jgi:hypothetical protein